MTFSDWNPGQPKGSLNHNCLAMYKTTEWHWHDAPCPVNRYGYICEISF